VRFHTFTYEGKPTVGVGKTAMNLIMARAANAETGERALVDLTVSVRCYASAATTAASWRQETQHLG
jgi:hypothetical protein